MIDFFKEKLKNYQNPGNSINVSQLDYSRVSEVKINGNTLDEIINGGASPAEKNSLEDATSLLHAGSSNASRFSFDKRPKHQIKLNKITKFLLKIRHSGEKINYYDPKTHQFKKTDDFTLFHTDIGFKNEYGTISADTKTSLLEHMKNKTEYLMQQLKAYTGTDREDIVNNLDIIHFAIESINNDINHVDSDLQKDMYVLVRKNSNPEDVSNHYGLVDVQFSIRKKDLLINNLIAHPYVVVNKYPVFRDYLMKKGIVSKSELDKFNIKNVARYLGAKAIKSEISYYETLPNSVDTFSFHASNPVTQRLGSQLEVMSKFLSRESSSDQQDFVHNIDDFAERKTDANIFKKKLEYLESNIRRDFNPIIPIKELPDAKVNEQIQKIMNSHGAKIVSNDIIDSQHSLNEEIKDFSLETISSVNLAYDKVSSVSSLFAKAESDLNIKSQLKALLDEATGGNDEVVTDADKTDAAEVSDMVYNRFRYNLNKLDEFLFKQKTGNYKSFVLFKYAHPDPSNPGAYALPFDSKKRILMAVLPKNHREGNLVDTLVHEASHVSSYTLDTTYIGNARGQTGSFPSSFEESSRSLKNFFENERVSNLSTKYILGLAENVEVTEQQQYLAHAMLLSSRLTRADTFLKSAEYNAYIIHVLSRAKLMGSRIYFDEAESRSKRSVFGGDNNLDQMILIASLANAMPDSQHPSARISIEISPKKSESYIIQPNDTLTSIAVRFYGKKKMGDIIYEANKDKFIDSDNLSSGKKLTIPKMVYTVKRGDTLESIALKFYGNNKHNIIYKANKKILSDKDSLLSGEKLIIPKRTYIVKNGETLKTIAMKFYGDTNKHTRIFHANKDKLIVLDAKSSAKRLVIPEIIYTTKNGDTLKSIARKIYGNKNNHFLIKEANKNLLISKDYVLPGQRLIIPKLNDMSLTQQSGAVE